LTSSGEIDPAGNNVFDGVTLGTATDSQLYAIEDKIVDSVDVSGYGFVRLKAGNVYVTPNSFYTPGGTSTPSIQRGIDAASTDDTVNVEAGTYTENVNVNKRITLDGQGSSGVVVTSAAEYADHQRLGQRHCRARSDGEGSARHRRELRQLCLWQRRGLAERRSGAIQHHAEQPGHRSQ